LTAAGKPRFWQQVRIWLVWQFTSAKVIFPLLTVILGGGTSFILYLITPALTWWIVLAAGFVLAGVLALVLKWAEDNGLSKPLSRRLTIWKWGLEPDGRILSQGDVDHLPAANVASLGPLAEWAGVQRPVAMLMQRSPGDPPFSFTFNLAKPTTSPWATRVDRDPTSRGKLPGKFSPVEMNRIGARIGSHITENNPGVFWITSLETDSQSRSIRVSYQNVGYFNVLALNFCLDWRFPATEYVSPREFVRQHLAAAAPGILSWLYEVPMAIGVEVAVVTADDQFVVAERSDEEAVLRGQVIQAVSGTPDWDRCVPKMRTPPEWMGFLEEIARGETRRELGLDQALDPDKDDEITSRQLLGLVYFYSTHSLNLLFFSRIKVTFVELERRHLEQRGTESWEHKGLHAFPVAEVRAHAGRWRESYESWASQGRLSDRLVAILHTVGPLL
jgi:hypothetical protein